jgi:23S rRNA pseudouridine2605 synthase
VSVDGRPAVPGQRVTGSERILVDQRPVRLLPAESHPRVLLYHKPAGEIVSMDDPQGRPTVFDHLPRLRDGRWISVGRLDFITSGVLLFTTSGSLAHALMHPSRQLEREYAVRVRGELSEQQAQSLLQGVALADGMARFDRLEPRGGQGSNRWYHVVLHEGRYREVRRMFEQLGITVSRLIRVRFGPLVLPPRLRAGRHQELGPREIDRLLSEPGMRPAGERQHRAADAPGRLAHRPRRA